VGGAVLTITDTSGAQFEIKVDGVVRSYRDKRDTAFEAARFLQQRNPGANISVTDLRDGSVVALKVEDIAPGGYTIDRATVRQRKTGRPVKFELTDQTREAVDDYLPAKGKKPGEFLFTGSGRSRQGMTTRQYARLVSRWVASIGLDARLFGTHSLPRTKATPIYRRTGNLRAVQLLHGHTKIESTVRYLGIEVDDALAIAEQTEV
jgi:integrase